MSYIQRLYQGFQMDKERKANAFKSYHQNLIILELKRKLDLRLREDSRVHSSTKTKNVFRDWIRLKIVPKLKMDNS